MKKRKDDVNYIPVNRVARWNYCQLIATYILNSSISDEELRNILLDIQGGVLKLRLFVE